MRFRVLGGVEGFAGDRRLVLNRRRERFLLGVLLLEAGQAVRTDRMIELLWQDPPEYARRIVHSHVARVRAALHALDPSVQLTTHGASYALRVDPEAVDVHRFRRLAAQAQSEQEPGRRAELLAEALALHTGEVLGDDADPIWRERLGADVETVRRTAEEQWLAALVDAGNWEEARGPLARLTAADPSREKLAELHMLALYRGGHKAEALAVYERTRAWLAEELGVDPAPNLRGIYQAILRDERLEASTRPAAVVPSQLPASPRGFTGREADLWSLDTAADTGTQVIGITGAGGTGKTALALHWAQRNRDRFPDGQLFLNLRGFDEAEPVAPREALSRLLMALGVNGDAVPANVDDAAALFRSVIADKQLLILLDNAHNVDQARWLLPGSGKAQAIVTSRRRLTGLIALNSAEVVSLNALHRQDALNLLADAIGPARAQADPDATDRLAALCGDLPLALRIAGAHLAARPALPVGAFAAELDSPQRLSLLSIEGDLRADMLATLELSFGDLAPDARQLLLLLALAPGEDIAVSLARALADMPDTDRLLRQLESAYLLEQNRPGRYRFHDLTRLFAHHQANRCLTAAERDSALDRLVGWYETADLAGEFGNVSATIVGLQHDLPVWRIAKGLHRLLVSGHDPVAIRTLAEVSLAAAEASEDVHGASLMHHLIAAAYWAARDPASALVSESLAVETAWRGEDVRLTAHHLNSRGVLLTLTGSYREGMRVLAEALEVAQRSGSRTAAVAPLRSLAEGSRLLGRYAEAEQYLARAIALVPDMSPSEATRHSLAYGSLLLETGSYQDGLVHAENALQLATARSDTWHMRAALALRGQLRRRLGDEAGHEDILAALTAQNDNPHVGQSSIILVPLAESFSARGDHATALHYAHECLREAESGGNTIDEAEATYILAVIHCRMHDHLQAVAYGHRAEQLFARMGQPPRLGLVFGVLAEAYAGLDEDETAHAYRGKAMGVTPRALFSRAGG